VAFPGWWPVELPGVPPSGVAEIQPEAAADPVVEAPEWFPEEFPVAPFPAEPYPVPAQADAGPSAQEGAAGRHRAEAALQASRGGRGRGARARMESGQAGPRLGGGQPRPGASR